MAQFLDIRVKRWRKKCGRNLEIGRNSFSEILLMFYSKLIYILAIENFSVFVLYDAENLYSMFVLLINIQERLL